MATRGTVQAVLFTPRQAHHVQESPLRHFSESAMRAYASTPGQVQNRLAEAARRMHQLLRALDANADR